MAHFKKQMITILSSATCNLNCEYCYVPRMKIKNEHKKIDVDFACLAIKDYFEQTGNYFVRYFGAGEPTIAFDEIKGIHEYAYNLSGGKLKAELQTNGYFNEEIAYWVNENINIVWISFDGMPELHDRQRPTIDGHISSDIVLRNIIELQKNPNIQLGVRVTITNGNFDRQIDIINFLSSLGVKYVCGSPSYSSTVNENTSTPEIIEFSRHFVDAYYYAQKHGMFYQTHLMVNFDEEVDFYCRACIPSPHVTTDGYISCCDWALLGAEYLPGVLQQLIYGEYDSQLHKIVYNNERIEMIQNRKTETLDKAACSGCVALNHCAGGCIGKTIVVSNDLYTPSDEWCMATKYLFEKLPVNQGANPCFHS